jgi:hypothetical protein
LRQIRRPCGFHVTFFDPHGLNDDPRPRRGDHRVAVNDWRNRWVVVAYAMRVKCVMATCKLAGYALFAPNLLYTHHGHFFALT